MAVVAQLVEPRVVISVVVGSSPISRPIFLLYPFCLYSILKSFKKTAAIFGIFLYLSILYLFASVIVLNLLSRS